MRKHRFFLLITAFLAILGVALYQSTSSQAAAGNSAAVLGSQLAADSLSGNQNGFNSVPGSADGPMGGLDIALASLHLPAPVAAPAVASVPAAPTTTTAAPAPAPVATPAPTPATPAAGAQPAASGYAPASGDWAHLRQCESGGNYSENSGNGYYGAYQFSLETWQGLGYSGLPSDAAPAVQDQAAQQLQARSGWGQWPSCSRQLGLS
jgi:hypothetical protein